MSSVSAQAASVRRLGDELLNSREVSVRRKAAQGLGRASTDQAVDLLNRAMAVERSTELRLEIVRALRTIVFQRYPGFRRALVALGNAADDATQRDELVRLRATEALWEAGKKDLLDPVPLLERQLTDRSERLRLSAVLMLRKHGSPEAAEALGRAVLNKGLTETVRLASIDALGAVSLSAPGVAGRTVVEANIAVANHLAIPALQSQRALELRHERQITYLAALVLDGESSETLVLQGVKSMGRVKDHASIVPLQRLVATHRSLAVRKQATKVLSHVLAQQYE
ncbi:MAG: HEAT repeat domain-containing protein [bacterium]|nr:HEAT repeat domain-containing protein [bacterium]